MMDGLLIMQTPGAQLVAKTALVLLLLLAIKRCQLAAATHALVWRIGLLVLLILPWVNAHVSYFEIPILPTLSHGSEQVFAAVIETAESPISFGDEQLTSTATAFWLWMVSGISLWLLLRLSRRIHQLRLITAAAKKNNNSMWQRINEQCTKQMNLPASPEILVTTEFRSPCTWGLFKPVVLIPEHITDDDAFRVVLLHELAHIKRQDWFWMMLAQTFTAIFWFNPVLWWVKSQLIQSFEKACDEMVLQQQVQPSCYVETLLSFHPSGQQALSQVTTSMAQPSAMYQRLNHILNPQQRSQIMNSNKQNLLLVSAGITAGLIMASQLTFAHETTVIEHEPSPTHAITPAAPTPASPDTSRLAVPTAPSPHAALSPPHPNRFPAAPNAVKPHSDGAVVPHPRPAPSAIPVVPDADHSHQDRALEHRLERAEHAAAEMAMKAKSHAFKKRSEAEEMWQLKQVELNHMAQQQALQQAEIKQQLAKIERQKQQLEAQLKRQAAQMAERIEMEKAHVRKEMKALKMAQISKEQAMKRAQQNHNQ